MVTAIIKGLFVGCGEIARTMMAHLAKRSWFEAAGAVDTNEAALTQACERLNLPPALRFLSLHEALMTCPADVVLINTPAELHPEQTQAALKTGRHVLVAKPMAESYADAAELVTSAGNLGLRIDVAEQMRYRRHYRALQAFLRAGALGKVQTVHFLNSKPRPHVGNLAAMRQPAILEMASHHFDILMALFPDHAPEWIMVDGYRPDWSPYAGPCMVNGLLRLAGGLHVLYHAGYSARASCYELRLEGERGALRCRGVHMSRPEMTYQFAPAGGDWAPIDLESDAAEGDAFAIFLDEWADALRTGRDAPFSGANNLKVMALMDAAIASIESGQPQEVAANPVYAPAFATGAEWRMRP